MIGRTISHYRILQELGAGGMGVVFAAEDVRLGRQVAIKFVPESVADDKQLFERLRSEARTASALNHPNICVVHDVGELDGRPFIVMELLQGRTLRERLSAGPLTITETIEIGIQVADALDAAHRLHIIHRDIKPANLILTQRGTIKILDFGLAKIVSHDRAALTMAPTDLTGVGMTLGTVSYMSPEQVTGDSLDGRSDLFSFGVVLYECATGHQPFKGKTSGLILSEILTRAPAAPLVLNPEIPLRLQEIITNCLEKDRELRYQDAAALRTDLKRLKRDLESGPRSVTRFSIPIETSSLVSSATSLPAAPGETATTPQSAPSTSSLPPAQQAKKYGGVMAAIVVTAALSTVAAFFAFRSANSRTPDAAPQQTAVERRTAPVPDEGVQALPAQPSESVRVTPPPPEPPRQEVTRPTAAPAAPLQPSAQAPQVVESPTPSIPAPPNVITPSIAPPVAVTPSPAFPLPPELPKPAAPAVASGGLPSSVAPQAEDDDSAIRRVLAAYARAIESKDLDAFRSVKPNLSAAEQRRLEDSFKAVASQKVDITVLSIERRASGAAVKVKRRDTLTVGGRSTTSDSQQTMTLGRTSAGWIISEIGR